MVPSCAPEADIYRVGVQFATSPRREASFEQRVAHRQPLPAFDLNDGRADRDGNRAAGPPRWQSDHVLSESPGLFRQHAQGAGAASMRPSAPHTSIPFTPDQAHRHSLQWSSPISELQPEAWGATALNTDRLFNRHASSERESDRADDKENDQPMLVSRMHGTPVVSAPSLLIKRAHAGSPYTADGGPAPKRVSQGGLRNWMSPVGKRKSGSAGASDMGFHDARKAYKMQRAAATMRADERIFSSTPAAVNIAPPKPAAFVAPQAPKPPADAPDAAATKAQGQGSPQKRAPVPIFDGKDGGGPKDGGEAAKDGGEAAKDAGGPAGAFNFGSSDTPKDAAAPAATFGFGSSASSGAASSSSAADKPAGLLKKQKHKVRINTNQRCEHALLELDGAGAMRGRQTAMVYACYLLCLYLYAAMLCVCICEI